MAKTNRVVILDRIYNSETEQYKKRIINYFTFKHQGPSSMLTFLDPIIMVNGSYTKFKVTKKLVIKNEVLNKPEEFLICNVIPCMLPETSHHIIINKDVQSINKTVNVKIPHLVVHKYHKEFYNTHKLKLKKENCCPDCFGTGKDVYFKRCGTHNKSIKLSDIKLWPTHCEGCSGSGDFTEFIANNICKSLKR